MLQYRYRKDLIHGDLITDVQALAGKPALLYFASGNDLQMPEDQRNLSYHPIRQVTIRKLIDDPVTDLVHLFLEMGEFANAVPHPDTPPTKLSRGAWSREAQKAVSLRATVSALSSHLPHW